MAATVHSPNKTNFYVFQTMTHASWLHSTWNICLLGGLELLSLVALWAFVQWRFGFNVFYLLAFVLETHVASVQGKILLFLTVTLNFNLIHTGKQAVATHTRCFFIDC